MNINTKYYDLEPVVYQTVNTARKIQQENPEKKLVLNK